MKGKAGIFLAAIALLGALGWMSLRVPYHKWRLIACAKNAERVRQGKIRTANPAVTLMWGDPKTAQDYDAAVAKHEAALIRLGYFERKEFRLATPLQSEKEKAEFLREAGRRFPDHRTWAVVFSQSGNSVTLTTERARITEWEKFIRKFNLGWGRVCASRTLILGLHHSE